jgi:hypothetical protein
MEMDVLRRLLREDEAMISSSGHGVRRARGW